MRLPTVPKPARTGRLHPFLNVPSYREVQTQLVTELRRARRYEHPLGVTLLGLRVPARAAGERRNGSPAAHEVDFTPAVYSLLGTYLRNTLRETDILTAAPEALAFATFLPDTDRRGTELALHRYSVGFQQCAGYVVDGGIAVFPGDGMTIEDVLDRAYAAWRQSRQPAVPIRPEQRYSHG